MRPSAKLIPLALVGLVVTGVVGFIVISITVAWFSNAPFGLGEAPQQPIAFPHDVHAGEPEEGGVGIECEFCHRKVTTGEAATVPAVQQCSFCHGQINSENLVGASAANQDEIAKVMEAFNQDRAIDWERVHLLPDHVRFVHSAHVRFLTQGGERTVTLPIGDEEPMDLPLQVEQSCSVCHGDVAGMAEVQPQQFQSLKMGTCVDCHRQNNVATDCSICHR